MATNKKTDATNAVKVRGSKRLRESQQNIERAKLYALGDAIKLVKNCATAKFDETIDIAISLGIDTRQSDQAVRGVAAMPNGTGKTIRVAVFAQDDKAKEAKDAGADLVGSDDLVEAIQKGEINFDRCIATPDMMSVIGKVAKILGPKGLMPNPKLGTVTQDVANAVKSAKSGQIEFRAEKSGIVHAGLGKTSFDDKALEENIKAFIKALNDAKPSAVKGTFLKKVALSSTMGPGIKIDVNSINAA